MTSERSRRDRAAPPLVKAARHLEIGKPLPEPRQPQVRAVYPIPDLARRDLEQVACIAVPIRAAVLAEAEANWVQIRSKTCP